MSPVSRRRGTSERLRMLGGTTMSEKPVVETIYGEFHKFDIVKDSGLWSTKFYIRKDGKPFKGPYPALTRAVEAAKQER